MSILYTTVNKADRSGQVGQTESPFDLNNESQARCKKNQTILCRSAPFRHRRNCTERHSSYTWRVLATTIDEFRTSRSLKGESKTVPRARKPPIKSKGRAEEDGRRARRREVRLGKFRRLRVPLRFVHYRHYRENAL
jgi:hypothetical protein